jgi:hypothetical protein
LSYHKKYSGWFNIDIAIHYLVYILLSKKDDASIEGYGKRFLNNGSIKKELRSIKQILIENNL